MVTRPLLRCGQRTLLCCQWKEVYGGCSLWERPRQHHGCVSPISSPQPGPWSVWSVHRDTQDRGRSLEAMLRLPDAWLDRWLQHMHSIWGRKSPDN